MAQRVEMCLIFKHDIHDITIIFSAYILNEICVPVLIKTKYERVTSTNIVFLVLQRLWLSLKIAYSSK